MSTGWAHPPPPGVATTLLWCMPRLDHFLPDEKNKKKHQKNKQKNPKNMTNINSALKDLYTKLNFIDDACYRYMDGNIDVNCFEDWVHLSEAGTFKLQTLLSPIMIISTGLQW